MASYYDNLVWRYTVLLASTVSVTMSSTMRSTMLSSWLISNLRLTRRVFGNRTRWGWQLAGDYLAGIPDREPVVIHAMPLRRTFYDLLPSGGEDS